MLSGPLSHSCGPSVQPQNQQQLKQLNKVTDIHINRTKHAGNKLLFTANSNQADHMHGMAFPSATETRTESGGFCHGGGMGDRITSSIRHMVLGFH